MPKRKKKFLPPAIVQDTLDKLWAAADEGGVHLSPKELFYRAEPPSDRKQLN